MSIVCGLFWILFISCQFKMHACIDDCTSRQIHDCEIDIINMTSGGAVKLLRLLENESNVQINKLVIAISPSGVFLQKISHLVAYLMYNNYREPTFNLPEGNTISEIQIMRASGLRAFVAGRNTNLDVLTIQQCTLDRLPQTLPKMTVLKQLCITNCMLSVLRLDMLVENQNLTTLDLSYNQIRQIFPVTGGPDRTLSIDSLMLTDNLLEHLDMTVFVSTPKLNQLLISQNYLTRFDVPVLITLPHLKNFFAYGNLIKSIDLRNLTLPNLSMLSLDSNLLTQMPFLPKLLPELYYLSINGNNISHLDLSYFRPYRKLEEIYLTSNQISTVRTSTPVRLPIESLDLQNNRIILFNMTGCDLPNMTSLDLGGNRLTKIPPVFERFPKLSITMDANPVTCHTLLPYKDKINSGKLYKDRVSPSSACDTTSSFLVGETIKVCCDG